MWATEDAGRRRFAGASGVAGVLLGALRGCLRTPRVRLAAPNQVGARTQGGGNSGAMAPTEDAAPRRFAAARRARGVLRQPLSAVALVATILVASPADARPWVVRTLATP